MLILHTAARYAPKVGGIEEVVKQISTRLTRRGHDVHVATSLDSSCCEQEVIDGVHVHRFNVKTHGAFGVSGDVGAFLHFVRSMRWEIIAMHSLTSWPTTTVLSQLMDLKSKKVVVGHGLRAFQDPSCSTQIESLAQSLRHVDRVVALSRLLEESQLCDRYGLQKAEIIPNGVDIAEWSRPTLSLRNRWRIGSRPWLLNVSNHATYKNHLAFFEVMRRIRKSLPDAVGMIIGGHYPAAKWGVGRFGIQGGCWYRCRLTGIMKSDVVLRWDVPREEVVSAMQEANITFLTSAFEASPLVILESMAASTPWLSFDVGCVRENVGGRVVEDIDGMVEAAVDLLHHEEKSIILGEAGRQRILQQHAWDIIGNRYETLYESLLRERTTESATSAFPHANSQTKGIPVRH